MYSVNLSTYQEVLLDDFDIEYALEELEVEEELASHNVERVQIETNRAYNEAEKYISELEENRMDPNETTEAKLQAMNEAIDKSEGFENGAELDKAKKKLKEVEEQTRLDKNAANKSPATNSANRKTTITYRLVDRKAMQLPNPVYTCDGSGKVVIAIEVNELGKVIHASYSKSTSTTSNECLIDSALEYARQARFTTDGSKTKQLGTITYNFPGQQ